MSFNCVRIPTLVAHTIVYVVVLLWVSIWIRLRQPVVLLSVGLTHVVRYKSAGGSASGAGWMPDRAVGETGRCVSLHPAACHMQ